MSASTSLGTGDEEGNPYAGWIASLLLVVVVLAIGAALWFHYHGL
jgi:hypothetical protein